MFYFGEACSIAVDFSRGLLLPYFATPRTGVHFWGCVPRSKGRCSVGRRKKSSYIIQSVTNALDLLEEFRGEETELGVTELSKRLGLHKNNVFRLLATLESRGYMEQNKVTGNYRLGLRVLELGQVFIKHMGRAILSRPMCLMNT